VPDAVTLHIIYRETMTHLESWENLAREGKDLMPALDFTRYVLWSGIVKLLKAYPAEGTLKVDGAFLEWKAKEVAEMIQAQFKGGKPPGATSTDLASINHKLDLIAGRLARITNIN